MKKYAISIYNHMDGDSYIYMIKRSTDIEAILEAYRVFFSGRECVLHHIEEIKEDIRGGFVKTAKDVIDILNDTDVSIAIKELDDVYKFNDEEVNIIKIAMENGIARELEKIKQYGYCDEATAGSDDFIDIAHRIIDELNKI